MQAATALRTKAVMMNIAALPARFVSDLVGGS